MDDKERVVAIGRHSGIMGFASASARTGDTAYWNCCQCQCSECQVRMICKGRAGETEKETRWEGGWSAIAICGGRDKRGARGEGRGARRWEAHAEERSLGSFS